MKALRNIITIAIILLMALGLKAQENNLTPCTAIDNEIKQILLYNKDLEKILLNEFKDEFILRFIAKPTFEPEYAFQIWKDSCLNMKISAIRLQENLWNSQERGSVAVFYFRRNIDKQLALEVDALFKLFTGSVQNEAFGFGLDGITFIFKSRSKDEVKCGKAWSPDKDSPLGELVFICNTLTDYAMGKDI